MTVNPQAPRPPPPHTPEPLHCSIKDASAGCHMHSSTPFLHRPSHKNPHDFPYSCVHHGFWNQQVGPKTPTPIFAAPATLETEMVPPNPSSPITALHGSQSASKGLGGGTLPTAVAGPTAAAGASTVAVDMDSPDVRAERDRVAGMTSFNNECIVIKDLRKVYPPQVGLIARSPLPSAMCFSTAGLFGNARVELHVTLLPHGYLLLLLP